MNNTQNVFTISLFTVFSGRIVNGGMKKADTFQWSADPSWEKRWARTRSKGRRSFCTLFQPINSRASSWGQLRSACGSPVFVWSRTPASPQSWTHRVLPPLALFCQPRRRKRFLPGSRHTCVCNQAAISTSAPGGARIWKQYPFLWFLDTLCEWCDRGRRCSSLWMLSVTTSRAVRESCSTPDHFVVTAK